MLRTKELLVFLGCTSFLLLAISLTLVRDGVFGGISPQVASAPVAVDAGPTTVAVADEVSAEPAYEEVVRSMRERVLAFRSAGGIDTDSFILSDRVPETIEETEVDSTDSGVQLCATYQPYSRSWPAGVEIAEREGARIVYTTVEAAAVGTSSPTPSVTEQVLLQLPVHNTPGAGTRCLATDVVGVAQDGSLIRNHEYGLYGIFDDATVVGYALDGFPIYGRNDSLVVDQCGGAVVSGQYGYVLQSERSAVVHCFSGVPAQI